MSSIIIDNSLLDDLVTINLNNFHSNTHQLMFSASKPFNCLWNYWEGNYPDIGNYNPWLVEEWLRYPDTEYGPINFPDGTNTVNYPNKNTNLIFTSPEEIVNGFVAISTWEGQPAPSGTQPTGIFLAFNISNNLVGINTRIGVSASGIPANLKNSNLRLYRLNEVSGQWETLTSGYDAATDTVWAEVTSFSKFGVFGQTAQGPVNPDPQPDPQDPDPQDPGDIGDPNDTGDQTEPTLPVTGVNISYLWLIACLLLCSGLILGIYARRRVQV